MTLKEKLESMIGKSFMYNARIQKILNYDLNGEMVIATNKKIHRFSLDNAESIIKEFLPVEDEIEAGALQILPKGNEMMDLKTTILDNINKVKDKPDFVKQANSINQSVNTLIKMATLEINYLKLMNRVR